MLHPIPVPSLDVYLSSKRLHLVMLL